MGLYHALFGAKPPYGTPPFAPPHLDTGGAMATPQPGQPQHGLAGFFDRLSDPTNSLGQIGMALLAGGGGPLGNTAALLMEQGASRAKARMPSLEHVGDTLGYVDPSTGKFTAIYSAPKDPTGFAGELSQAGIDPSSDEGVADLKAHVQNALDPWISASNPQGSYYGPRSGLTQVFGGGAAGGTPSSGPAIGDVVDDPRQSAPAAAGYDAFKKAIIGQETGGRYGVPNAQGSGAMGVGQVMPSTAKVLAGRLGLPYQPNLMAGTDLPSRSYQDQITEAAVRDAWQAGGGDPAVAAMHYFGGSDQGKWGPKTHQYATDILSRIAG